MGRIKGRTPSPAMVVAIVALVFAVAGSAVAGVATISVLSKKEKKQTRNIAKDEINKAAPGLSVANATNAQNATNAGLLDGKSRSELLAGTYSSRFLNNSGGGAFGPVSGIGPNTNTDESAVVMPSPASAIVARDLFARYASDTGAGTPGSTRTFILRVNSADSSLTCTYTVPATSCSNTTNAVTISPGSSLSIRFAQGGTSVGFGIAEVAFRATTP